MTDGAGRAIDRRSRRRASGCSSARARLGSERLPLRSADGRILAEPARSRVAVPGFDNSAMDGYAVRAADTAAPSPAGARDSLRIVGESQGRPPGRRRAWPPARRSRSRPGRWSPAGADAVIRVEDTEPDGEPGLDPRRGRARQRASAAPARTSRPGRVLVEAGTRLGAAELGALAAGGHRRAGLRAPPARLGAAHRRRARRARPGAPPGPDPRLERLRGAAAGRRRRRRGRRWSR